MLNIKEILTRKPFFEVTPYGGNTPRFVTSRTNVAEPEEKAQYRIVTQAEFLRQLYPTGHKINDAVLYPDVYKQDPDTGKYYIQPITRCAFAMQQVIAVKQTVHLTGNDVQFELAEQSRTEGSDDDNNKLLLEFKKGWLEKNMEMYMYDSIYSIKTTADTALVCYMHNGKFGCKVLSYLNEDHLYPHYDSITGELTMFARKYYDYDDEGNAFIEWVEVWDEKYLYRAKRNTKEAGVVSKIKDIFGLNGYTIISQEPHGFNEVPVAYYREESGPCWLPAQDTIEKYEEAYSYFFENNKAFAFPIMVLKGDGVDIKGDENGAVKVITIEDSAGSAEFLQHNDVSLSYNTLLNTLYQLIYEQSFTVKPPELKSGDLPGVALKLLYSPAIEKAIVDTQNLQPFLEKVVHLFKYGWGLEVNKQASMLSLAINSWIEPYVHQNDTELTTNLASAVQNQFLSKQTASERFSKFSKNDEIARIAREQVEKMKLEVEKQELIKENETDEQIRLNKANAGQDINTGQGKGAGRPNRSGLQWENSNYEGRVGWPGYEGEEYKNG